MKGLFSGCCTGGQRDIENNVTRSTPKIGKKVQEAKDLQKDCTPSQTSISNPTNLTDRSKKGLFSGCCTGGLFSKCRRSALRRKLKKQCDPFRMYNFDGPSDWDPSDSEDADRIVQAYNWPPIGWHFFSDSEIYDQNSYSDSSEQDPHNSTQNELSSDSVIHMPISDSEQDPHNSTQNELSSISVVHMPISDSEQDSSERTYLDVSETEKPSSNAVIHGNNDSEQNSTTATTNQKKKGMFGNCF